MQKLKKAPRPVLDPATGDVIGHVPARESKNKVLGVKRCEGSSCNLPITVHDANGKRAGYWYTVCDNCKNDQRTGAEFQAMLRDAIVPIIEDLPDFTAADLASIEKDGPTVEYAGQQKAAHSAVSGTESETESKTVTHTQKTDEYTGVEVSASPLNTESESENTQVPGEDEQSVGTETEKAPSTRSFFQPVYIVLGAILGGIAGRFIG